MAIFSGIAAAVGGLLGGTFLGGLGGLLLKTAVGVGLNLLARRIARKDEVAKEPPFALSGKLQSGGDVPRSIMLGRGMTAGSLVYANTWGTEGDTPNAFFTQVIALSDLPVAGLDEVWVNGEQVTLDDDPHPSRGFPVLEYRIDGVDHLWIKFKDGTQTTADSFLTGTVASAARPYASTRVGRGVAHAICTALIDEELFTGFPAFKFVLQGVRLYDPSRDTSVGGSGSQRLNNPATWGGDGDDLPAVQIYNLLLGLSYGGKWVYGVQALPQARLPAVAWIDEINKCRASENGPSGPEPAYRAGGEVFLNAEVADTIEALLTACQGRLCESGGFYRIHVGAPNDPVGSFTDDDILSTEEQTFTPFFGLADTITGINARYPSPADGWTIKVAPPRIDAELEEKAGDRRLLADVNLDYVPYKGQVQRLMKSALEEAQRARRHTFVMPPRFWGVEPGDYLSWTSARNGYITKLFRVDGVNDLANLDVQLDLTEVDPSDYDWNQDTDYRVPVDGTLGIQRPAPQVVSGFGVEAIVILNQAGTAVRPGLRLFWDWSATKRDIEAVQFEVRREGALSVTMHDRTDTPEAGEVIITPYAMLPETAYEVRARFVSKSKNRPMSWSAWLPVTTLAVASDNLVYLANLQRDIREEMQRNIQEYNDTQVEFEALIANILAKNVKDFGDAVRANRQGNRVRTQIVEEREQREELGTAFASFQTVVTAQVENLTLDLSGLGAAFNVLETEVTQIGNTLTVTASNLNAAIARINTAEGKLVTHASAINSLESTVSVQGNQISAQANALTSVTATANQATASGLIRLRAVSSPSGVSVRFAVEAKTTSGGSYRFAGFYLDLLSNGSSRFMVLSDQFVVTDGTRTGFPFVYEGSELKLALASIVEIRSGLIRSQNGNMRIELDNNRILIAD